MTKAIDMTGQRFGRLTVQGRALKSTTREAQWVCLCDCGKTTTPRGSQLRNGHTQSCGCLSAETAATLAAARFALPPGEAAINDLMARYRRQAAKRDITFDLTRPEFKALVVLDCHYCGAVPAQQVQARYSRKTPVAFNGVDRKDSAKGYVMGNVVPACGMCNRAKGTASVADFIAWARRVVDRA
jgi:hypothetical protein